MVFRRKEVASPWLINESFWLRIEVYISRAKNMKENYFFKSTKGEIERKQEAAEIKPLTADEYEETEQKPMTFIDHSRTLRRSIQEKLTIEKPGAEEQERIRLLSELITPELMGGYKQVVKNLNEKTRKTEKHPQREFIDINSDEISTSVEDWIENLISDLKKQKEITLDETDLEEIRAESWLLFDAMGNVMNTRSLEKDIVGFYAGKTLDTANQKEEEKKKLVKDLQGRYPFRPEEIDILVNMVRAKKMGDEEYSLKLLTEEIAKLWQEYKLGEKKGELSKISLGYLMSKGAESLAPMFLKDLVVDSNINPMAYLEFFGLGRFSEVFDAHLDIRMEKVINEINHQINERMSNSIFFHEFEFIHEKSLGEIYVSLERGKDATKQLLKDVISRFAPALSGITMSMIFLTKINPILGAIGIGSLPIMYKIAKKQSGQMHSIYEKSKNAEEKMLTRLESIKTGFEEVKTSSDTPMVAKHVSSHLDSIDDISLERTIKYKKMSLLQNIPFHISDIVAVSVGAALQGKGLISAGAVLSNMMYSRQMTGPVESLVNMYFNDFARNIQDIKHAEKIFGEYDKLDLPEGKKEKERVPVSSLDNFDISIKNLQYKDILQGINLEIKQGEFLTIAGASGAGKSTLLRNLAGLYHPDGGSVEIGGTGIEKIKKYGKESIYSVMSYSNQSPQFFDGMTLRENLMLWSKEKIDDEKIKKVLNDLHLEKFTDKLDEEVKNLSGGEKVRVGVARTLIKGAKIMLLDEPTASLDSQAATEVRKIISEINEKYPDTTIICVSHDDELIKISKRSVNMREL
jgi:putative ABC transport system ATP-binding protein